MYYEKKPKTDIEKAMYEKKTNIAEAQKRKQNSMEILACFRDATLMTVAEIGKSEFDGAGLDQSEQAIKEMWERWHSWLKGKLDKEILGF